MRDIVCQRIKAFLDFAFPDDNHMPAGLLQGGLLFLIAFNVALEFLRPEFHIRFRHCGDFAAFMAMPETTVDENHRMPFGQNDIGMSGQFRRMKAVAKAQRMQMMTHDQFRLRVLRPDFAHGFAAFFWRDGIHIVELVVVIRLQNNIARLFFQTTNGHQWTRIFNHKTVHKILGAGKAATKLSLRNHRSYRLHRFFNHKTLKTNKKASPPGRQCLKDSMIKTRR